VPQEAPQAFAKAVTRAAIAAAKAAYAEYRNSTLFERGAYLQRLHDAVAARMDEHVAAIVDEYGGTRAFARAAAKRAADYFLQTKKTMEAFAFARRIGRATVHMDSLGVVGIITPWNASSSFVASKLAMALAVGSTTVIKPSELSAWQTQILVECLHAAELPPGSSTS
jgi:aldehyde dehydrogenase (NAD+)